MLNIEYWKDKLIKIREDGDIFAVLGSKPCSCSCLECEECDFNSADCEEEAINWLCSEYKEPEIDWDNDIDWMRVPVDTDILVRDDDEGACLERKFAIYIPEAHYRYVTFDDGKEHKNSFDLTKWKYCMLANKEDIEKYRKR